VTLKEREGISRSVSLVHRGKAEDEGRGEKEASRNAAVQVEYLQERGDSLSRES